MTWPLPNPLRSFHRQNLRAKRQMLTLRWNLLLPILLDRSRGSVASPRINWLLPPILKIFLYHQLPTHMRIILLRDNKLRLDSSSSSSMIWQRRCTSKSRIVRVTSAHYVKGLAPSSWSSLMTWYWGSMRGTSHHSLRAWSRTSWVRGNISSSWGSIPSLSRYVLACTSCPMLTVRQPRFFELKKSTARTATHTIICMWRVRGYSPQSIWVA